MNHLNYCVPRVWGNHFKLNKAYTQQTIYLTPLDAMRLKVPELIRRFAPKSVELYFGRCCAQKGRKSDEYIDSESKRPKALKKRP